MHNGEAEYGNCSGIDSLAFVGAGSCAFGCLVRSAKSGKKFR